MSCRHTNTNNSTATPTGPTKGPTGITKEYREWSIRLLRARAKLTKRGEKLRGRVWYPSGYVDTTNTLPKPLGPQPIHLHTVPLGFHFEKSLHFTNENPADERVFKPIAPRDNCQVLAHSPRKASGHPVKKRKRALT